MNSLNPIPAFFSVAIGRSKSSLDVVNNRLVVLFAETGTGKTSLINAGVRPRLEKRGYSTFFIRVHGDPAESARVELLSHGKLKKLRGETLADIGKRPQDLGQPIVLFFDQFEEFFQGVFREDRPKAGMFITQVAEVHDDEDSNVHIVFSLREDWFVEMDAFRDQIPTIFHNGSNLRLRSLDKTQAKDAIAKHPAAFQIINAQAKNGITEPPAAFEEMVEGRLVDRLLTELADDEGRIEPARLQIVCDTIWKKRSGDRMSLWKTTPDWPGTPVRKTWPSRFSTSTH